MPQFLIRHWLSDLSPHFRHWFSWGFWLLLGSFAASLTACDDAACNLRKAQGQECDVFAQQSSNSLVDRIAPTVKISTPAENAILSNQESTTTVSGIYSDEGGSNVAAVVVTSGPATSYILDQAKFEALSPFLPSSVQEKVKLHLNQSFETGDALIEAVQAELSQPLETTFRTLITIYASTSTYLTQLNAGTATFYVEKVPLQEGTNTLQAIAIDGGGNPASHSMKVRRNRLPTVSAGDDQVVSRGTLTLKAQGQDPDGDSLTYTWEVTADPQTVKPTGTTDKSTAIYTLSTKDKATYHVIVTANDGKDNSIATTVDIVATNNPPKCDPLKDQSFFSQTGNYALDLRGSALDLDGDDLAYQWNVEGPVIPGAETQPTYVLPSANTLATNLTLLYAGQYKVTFSANDGTSECIAVATLELKLGGTFASAGPDQTFRTGKSCRAGITFSDAGSFDPQQSNLQYVWTVFKPDRELLTLPNPNQRTISFTGDQCGVYQAILAVRGTSWAFDEVQASLVNQGPTAKFAPVPSFSTGHPQNLTIVLDGSGSFDSDGDAIVSYNWSLQRPDKQVVALGKSPVVIIPGKDLQVGDYIASLSLSDGVTTSTGVLNFAINNKPPIAKILPLVKACTLKKEKGIYQPVTAPFISFSTDPDGDALSYKWKSEGESGKFPVDDGRRAFLVIDRPDTYTITLIASDGGGSSDDSVELPVTDGAGGCQ